MKKKLMLILTCLVLSVGFVVAQTTKASGVVLDDTGETVPGASVVVKGTTVGTATDVDGKFSLNVPEGKNTLVVSFIGLKSQEVKAGVDLRIILGTDEARVLDDVVVTGYGVTKKTAFTGAASTIDSKALTSKTDANFMKTLQGSVTGLQMNNSTGMPGADASVLIRGVGSYNAGTQPLYIVDGTPMISDPDAMSSTNKQYFSPMANINPSDIQSVTVLKDAAATAIYGSRAANGVIVITTKRGSSEKLNINLNVKKGVTKMSPLMHDYKIINAEEWIDIWGTALVNSGDAANKLAGDAKARQKAESLGYDGTNGIDWLDAVTRTGNVDEYSLDISGKSQSTNYFASGGYYRNEGIIINTGLERYTGRFNFDTKYKFITFGANLSGAYSISNGVPTNSSYTNPIVAVYGAVNPVTPIYNTDGTYNLNAYYNPVAVNDPDAGDLRQQKILSANINPYVLLDLSHGLYWKTSFGLNVFDLNEYQFWSPYNAQGAQYNGLGQKYNDTRKNIILTNTLNWLHTFKDVHNINILLGQEVLKTSDYYEYYAASNYSFLGYRDMVTAAEPQGSENSYKTKTLASFFLNAQYDYRSRYYLSGSIRRDGASTFGKDKRWGTFWSLGAKWRVSEEDFWLPLKEKVENVAVRASYGAVGNSDTSSWYASRGFYTTGYNYNNQPGMRPGSVNNNELGWEGVHKLDIGFDALLFGRVNLTFDYFDERTKDLLFDVPVSMTTGISTVIQNIGEMQNTGLEFGVNANVVRNNNFSWNIYANITAAKNKMKKTVNGEDITPSVGSTYRIIREGESFNSFFLKEWAGVDPDTGSPLWYKADGTKTNVWDEAEQKIVGNADPDFYGGFGTNLTYKGFDLNATFAYSYGNKVYGAGLSSDLQVGKTTYGNVTYYVYDNAWTEDNRYTNVPKFVYGDASGANNASTRFLMDGSYLRLQSVTLGYTLPKYLVNKCYLNNIRVYASADNLFTVRSSDYIGFDPESLTTGGQMWQYPSARTFSFGVNIGF